MKTQNTSIKPIVTAFTLITMGVICAFWSTSQAIAGDNSLIGSWTATVTPIGMPVPPFQTLPNFSIGGTVIVPAQGDSAPRLLLPPPNDQTLVLQSPGVGVWKKIGARTFAVTLVAMLYDQNGILLGNIKINSIFELNNSGDEFDSETSIGVVTDPNGNLLLTLEASVHGERIDVELAE
jgi:hypothetical protein